MKKPKSILITCVLIFICVLTLNSAQADILNGSDILDEPYPYGIVKGPAGTIENGWHVNLGDYYSPLYFFTPSSYLIVGIIETNTLGTFTLYSADDGGGNPPTGPAHTIQYFTSEITLNTVVNSEQSFDAQSVSIFGGQEKYFGFSVNLPNSPSPVYGWLELDGRASTIGHLIVSGSWAYDTTGSAIQVGAVPEPSIYALFGLGAVGMLIVIRRKKTA
jgi:PEP-CTERM motif